MAASPPSNMCSPTSLSDFPNEYFDPESIANNSNYFTSSNVGNTYNLTTNLDMLVPPCNGIKIRYCYKTNITSPTSLFEFSLKSSDETVNVSTILRTRYLVDICFMDFCCSETPLDCVSISTRLNVSIRITIMSGSLLQLNDSIRPDFALLQNTSVDQFIFPDSSLLIGLEVGM